MTTQLTENNYDALPVISLIRSKLETMTRSQRALAEYVICHPTDVTKMSISQLATETGLKSESSVVRFYRTLGFSGYHDFKVTLAKELGGSSFYHTYEDILFNDGIDEVKKKIFKGAIQTLMENLSLVPNDQLEAAVDLINNAGRIFFLGYASSGAIALEGFFKFSRLNSYCYFFSDSHVNAALLSEPLPGDVLFCISHSGETKDLIIPAENAKPTAKIIVLTGSQNSHLAKIADVCITTFSEEVNYRTEVMVSRIVQLAIIEVLFTACSLKKGPKTFERLSETAFESARHQRRSAFCRQPYR